MATSILTLPLETTETTIDTQMVSHTEAAQYVEAMCGELAQLSDRVGLGFLAYLLEVAREEASLHSQDAAARTMHGELPPI